MPFLGIIPIPERALMSESFLTQREFERLLESRDKALARLHDAVIDTVGDIREKDYEGKHGRREYTPAITVAKYRRLAKAMQKARDVLGPGHSVG